MEAAVGSAANGSRAATAAAATAGGGGVYGECEASSSSAPPAMNCTTSRASTSPAGATVRRYSSVKKLRTMAGAEVQTGQI